MRILVILALIAFIGVLGADENAPRVFTSLGSIKGFRQTSRGGREFQSFEGIPYAQPPLGELRFQPPRPIASLPGEFPATKPGSKCLQYLHIYENPNERVTGSEDCLYLNVYKPVDTDVKNNASDFDKSLLPVVFYIHGGAFQFGSGSDHNPHFLMDYDVVVVTFNYRLGPLGFLSTEDSVVPGNMGLKDQSLALRWVSENIEYFGGDPDSVTIFGLSAGGASVHYHYLSPLSRGLFHRGMSISGTALDCWAQTEASLEKAKKLGAIMGCPTDSNNELVRCLKSRPSQRLYEVESEFMGWLYNPYTPFGPVLETSSMDAFIDKSPIDIITSGQSADLPWIVTVVTEEGLYPVAEFIADKKLMQELDEKWEILAPYLLDYNYTMPQEEQANVARKARKHYLGDLPINRESATNLIHMVGDRLFVVDGFNAAKRQSKVNKSPVRYYRFSYRGENSLSDVFTRSKENFGVSHADDVFYVFAGWLGALISTPQDLAMSRYLLNLWTSYATTGVPEVGVEWPRVDLSKGQFDFLHITGPGEATIETGDNFGEERFWHSLGLNRRIGSQEADDDRRAIRDRLSVMDQESHRLGGSPLGY